MEMKAKIMPVFILILLVPLTSYGQQMGTLEIDMKSVGGEMTDYHGMALKIYQDNEKIPYKTINSLSGNQYNIEVYVGSMYANTGYVDLQDNNEKLVLIIPNPGSILFTAVYDDGNTPI